MRALLTRFPTVARGLARVDLRVSETPVEQWNVGGTLLAAKRDDLSAPALGGNKVRALECLLAGVGPDETILTVGAAGSTHALAVAHYAARLGARTEVITWAQEMNDVALATSKRLEQLASVTRARTPADAYARAWWRRRRPGVRWIPAGGSVPMGALGHVSAALELASQCERAGLPMPDAIVVPLGSGGTVAGLLVGLSLAGATTRVVGARVVPIAVANRWRVLRLARQTRALLHGLVGGKLPPLDPTRLEIDGSAFGGGYGRETDAGRAAAAALAASGGPRLDGTYSAKAFAVALDRARRIPAERILFWLTFDARWLSS
ncbi:MAG: pyridoxal-phosphate dependent enzyme [Gemmatimonadota bacterium]